MHNSIRRRTTAFGGVAVLAFATVGFVPLSASALPSAEVTSPNAESYAHDTMGSTIRANDPNYSKSASMVPRALKLAATPSGTRGLDVSHWQGAINWNKVSSNVKFAYIKATESTNYSDPQFNSNYTGAYKAGKIRGAYHFALPNKASGAAQASYFVSHGGGWSSDGKTLPPLLDMEYNPYGSTCYGLSASQMVSWIKSFSNQMVKLTGRPPAIYTTTDWWKSCTGNSSAFSNSPLFVARYNSTVGTLPNGWPVYTFWQYSDADNPPSYPGDQDVFNGSLAQLKKLASGGSTADPPKQGYKSKMKIGNAGWQKYDKIVGVGDFNGDGKSDLFAFKPNGTLWYYAGTGNAGAKHAGYKAKVKIGNAGWQKYKKIVGVGDFNGDKKPDVVAVGPKGALWFFAGLGNPGPKKRTFKPKAKIGTSGWQKYDKVVGVGDFNGDKKPDMVATGAKGKLWFYAGLGNSGK